jgi:hypothetical protein
MLHFRSPTNWRAFAQYYYLGIPFLPVTNIIMATPGSCSQQDNQTTSIASLLKEESNQFKKPVEKIKIYIDPTEKQTGKTGQ